MANAREELVRQWLEKAEHDLLRILRREAALLDERRQLAERFITRVEPLVKLHATCIKSGDRSTLLLR